MTIPEHKALMAEIESLCDIYDGFKGDDRGDADLIDSAFAILDTIRMAGGMVTMIDVYFQVGNDPDGYDDELFFLVTEKDFFDQNQHLSDGASPYHHAISEAMTRLGFQEAMESLFYGTGPDGDITDADVPFMVSGMAHCGFNMIEYKMF